MTAKNSTLLSLVVPMYNEAEGLGLFFERIIPVLNGITHQWEIVCIDDGSKDSTYADLLNWHSKDPRITLIKLSRNFGKEAALTAGIDHSIGQAVIPIDADMQDPPEVIPEMVAKWRQGAKVVLATRRSRDEDSWLKRTTANGFYRVFKKLARFPVEQNTGDFRLLDRVVVNELGKMRERTRFMKGLLSWPGFTTAQVFFDRAPRAAGNSSWNYLKLWQFAIDGICSFTTLPLKIWTYVGAIISLFSFIYAAYLIFRTMLFGIEVPGYASVMTAVLFIGGVQLLSLGIIGEYISHIYREVKGRPIYVVEEKSK